MTNNHLNTDTQAFQKSLSKGDRVAYETLFRLYYDKLLHLAKGYLVNPEDAKGVVQNVFLKLWEDKKYWSKVKNINNYLYTMTKNACLDHLKHEKVKNTYFDNHKQALIQKRFIKDEAAAFLLENELGAQIEKAINQLPKKCKAVFLKSRIEGLKHHEIAEKLGISKRTVNNHITFAIKQMKLHLKDFLTLIL